MFELLYYVHFSQKIQFISNRKFLVKKIYIFQLTIILFAGINKIVQLTNCSGIEKAVYAFCGI